MRLVLPFRGPGGLLPEDALLSRGPWQYAHYYDPAAPDPRVTVQAPLVDRYTGSGGVSRAGPG